MTEKINSIINSIFTNLEAPEKLKNRNLCELWPEIAGKKVAAHTKAVFGPGGKLIVWVDQSTLAFELKQRYQSSLLKRAQAALGEDAVKSIWIRVGQLR